MHRPLQRPAEATTLGTGRLEAFSDGVFAIVVTLLVLEIHVPQVSGSDLDSALGDALVEAIPKMLRYMLGLALVSIYWVSHHQLFRLLRGSDRGLLWLNSLFLMALAFVPFPSGVIGVYPQTQRAVILCGAVMAVVGLTFTLLRWYATQVAHLADPVDPMLLRAALCKSLASPIRYGLGTALAAVQPTPALLLYVAIPMLYFLPNRVDHHAPAPESGDSA